MKCLGLELTDFLAKGKNALVNPKFAGSVKIFNTLLLNFKDDCALLIRNRENICGERFLFSYSIQNPGLISHGVNHLFSPVIDIFSLGYLNWRFDFCGSFKM